MKVVISAILAALFISYYFPQVSELEWLLPYLLSGMLFTTFVKTKFEVKKLFKKRVLAAFLVSVGLVPFIVVEIARIFNFSYDIQLGLFLIAITPTAMAAPTIAGEAGLNKEVVLSSVLISNLLAPVTYPLLLNFYYDQSFSINFFNLFLKVFVIVILPVSLSLLFKKVFAKIPSKILSKISTSMLFAVIFLAVTSVSGEFFNGKIATSVLLISFLVVFILSSFLYWGSYFLAILFHSKWSKSLSLSLGHKNNGLTIGLLPVIGAVSPEVVTPILLYMISHHIHNGILISLNNKKIKDNNKVVD